MKRRTFFRAAWVCGLLAVLLLGISFWYDWRAVQAQRSLFLTVLPKVELRDVPLRTALEKLLADGSQIRSSHAKFEIEFSGVATTRKELLVTIAMNDVSLYESLYETSVLAHTRIEVEPNRIVVRGYEEPREVTLRSRIQGLLHRFFY